ncbi:MAG: hypothetical protein D6768_20900 [Chloroflexi bacterium]|nr:MAG: hypothetical protein D6768_20900 [Chloroflexota bacterium]
MDNKRKFIPVKWMAVVVVVATLWLTATALASGGPTYAIPWWTIDGGGGTSSGPNYSVSGTIGQFDARTSAMSNGNFSVTGGFWNGISQYNVYLPLVLK